MTLHCIERTWVMGITEQHLALIKLHAQRAPTSDFFCGGPGLLPSNGPVTLPLEIVKHVTSCE
jgi:hypothetical protein